MRIRTGAALALGKALGSASRMFKAGGGTTFPGRVVRALFPRFIPEMVSVLPRGCILVTGTNGKTTTAALLSSILETSGIESVHNRSGANLMAGIASALIRDAGIREGLSAGIGLFEVDEAALPAAVEETSPRLVLVNNLFRDQLDRYGELDTLAGRMKAAVGTLEEPAVVVLNADDPLVASIGEGLSRKVVYYGIETDRYASLSMQHAADSKHCVRCGTRLDYRFYLFGHLGRYACPSCGLERPRVSLAAAGLDMRGMDGTDITLDCEGTSTVVHCPLPGLYNVYNVLAAITCALQLGVDIGTAAEAVGRFEAAFGRVEKVRSGNRTLLMILAKNPAGYNEVIRTLTAGPGGKDVLLALNDNIADGRDVSWIWDVDFEMFRGALRRVVCSGTRAWDMALRVKHAMAGEESTTVEPDLQEALDTALEAVPEGGTLYLVPTYTAMLELRGIMAKRGLVGPYWEE